MTDEEQAFQLLSEYADIFDEPCRRDHHGYCQSHFLELNCVIYRTKQFLGKANEALVD